MTTRRTAFVGAALVVIATLCTAVVGDEAEAHSDQGLLSVEATTDDTGRRIIVTAKLTYANDGEPVSSADVSAFASSAADESTAPATLTPEGAGRYEGTLKVPSGGEWIVVVRSEQPMATANAPVVLPVDTPTTTTVAPTTTAELDRHESASPTPRDDDDGNSTPRLVAVVVIVCSVLASIVVVLRRRYRRPEVP